MFALTTPRTMFESFGKLFTEPGKRIPKGLYTTTILNYYTSNSICSDHSFNYRRAELPQSDP